MKDKRQDTHSPGRMASLLSTAHVCVCVCAVRQSHDISPIASLGEIMARLFPAIWADVPQGEEGRGGVGGGQGGRPRPHANPSERGPGRAGPPLGIALMGMRMMSFQDSQTVA